MAKTSIEWTATKNADGTVTPGVTWNPIRGCSMAKGSETGGCLNCYAARMASRNLPEMKSPTTGEPFARITRSGPRWTGKVELIESKLNEPLRWRKPRKVFVNSMSDLFHENLPDEDIDRVFSVMAGCHKHVFQVLTKRPQRMLAYLKRFKPDGRGWITPGGQEAELTHCPVDANRWPLRNVWLGVSVENQQTADERIPLLLKTPAAIRFVSYEPALEGVDFAPYMPHEVTFNHRYEGAGLTKHHVSDHAKTVGPDWVIVGGESGPGARPSNPEWFRSIRDQCAGAGVSFFFKQWGEYAPYHPAPLKVLEGIGLMGLVDCEGYTMRRVGKKAAGHLLDGVEHREFPKELIPLDANHGNV